MTVQGVNPPVNPQGVNQKSHQTSHKPEARESIKFDSKQFIREKSQGILRKASESFKSLRTLLQGTKPSYVMVDKEPSSNITPEAKDVMKQLAKEDNIRTGLVFSRTDLTPKEIKNSVEMMKNLSPEEQRSRLTGSQGSEIAKNLATTPEGQVILKTTINSHFKSMFLNNTFVQESLQKFCNKELSGENTSFILDTEKAIQTAKTPEEKSIAINHLLTTYVNPGTAEKEVNLPAAHVKKLNEDLAKNPTNLEAFKPCQDEILGMTLRDTVPRWLRDPAAF
jgi:hypothetical protein